MDNLANLYHGNEGKDDWASSFEKLVSQYNNHVTM